MNDYEIDHIAEEIRSFCVRYGRLGGQAKNKYDSVRFYAQFGVHSLHDMIHPGWANYSWYPKWLIHLNIYYFPIIFKYLGITWFFSKWQPIIYSFAYKRALKKYPHLQAEILSDCDYPEMIKGHSRKEGKYLHILDMNGKIVSTWITNDDVVVIP